MKPNICILKTDGTNCDQETKYAFELAGGRADIVLLHELKRNPKKLHDYQILTIPGGFSYGDDIASGVILATQLLVHMRDELERFVYEGKLILGICNGFQALVRAGLLPHVQLGKQTTTLTDNRTGRFECRWVDTTIETSPCVFTQTLQGLTVPLQIAHGEGNFLADQNIINGLEQHSLIALRYTTDVNGSRNNIAGICDATGRILGLMPHPERFVSPYQYPNWRRQQMQPYGLALFQAAVQHAG